MNEFFKLLRDFVIFIPLGILIFGIFFVLLIVGKDNLALLPIGLLIVLYGLIASYIRQIYKDYLRFLKEEKLSAQDYLAKWKKYHRYYYIVQFLLLGVFVYILWNFILMTDLNSLAINIHSAPTISTPFWQNFEFWSVVVLAITAFFLIQYTRATKQMAENQMMPSVAVNMVFDKALQKTYFWFINSSNIPALVEMKLITEGREYQIGPYHVPSHLHPFAKSAIKRTAASFDFLEGHDGSHKNNTEAILDVLVRADIKNRHISIHFTKNYRFNESNKEWDETTWSFPDVPFPEQA